jgi:hypothetical protein
MQAWIPRPQGSLVASPELTVTVQAARTRARTHTRTHARAHKQLPHTHATHTRIHVRTQTTCLRAHTTYARPRTHATHGIDQDHSNWLRLHPSQAREGELVSEAFMGRIYEAAQLGDESGCFLGWGRRSRADPTAGRIRTAGCMRRLAGAQRGGASLAIAPSVIAVAPGPRSHGADGAPEGGRRLQLGANVTSITGRGVGAENGATAGDAALWRAAEQGNRRCHRDAPVCASCAHNCAPDPPPEATKRTRGGGLRAGARSPTRGDRPTEVSIATFIWRTALSPLARHARVRTRSHSDAVSEGY